MRSKVLTLHGEFSCLLFILSAISYFFVAIFHFYLQYFTYISCLYWLRLNSKLWQSLPKVKRYWKTSGARISLDGGGGGERGAAGAEIQFLSTIFCAWIISLDMKHHTLDSGFLSIDLWTRCRYEKLCGWKIKYFCRAHKIFSSENGFSTQGQNWADGDGDNVIIIMVREAILSKKCSFF